MEDHIAHKTSSHPAQKQYRLRTVILICSVVFLASSFITATGMLVAFVAGQGTKKAVTTESQRQTVVQEGEVIEEIADDVSPSVVSIIASSSAGTNFFGESVERAGAGTGVIISSDGLVLTNKHVVVSGTNKVEIIDHEGVSYKNVEIVGRDPLNDLAILRINSNKNFAPARLADSDQVKTGQKVIAIGNALGQFQNSVTAGIISGKGRPITASDGSGTRTERLSNLFQTDAAINSGNSGGPLLNINGEVIGIDTAIAEDAQNIGFSIPINEAKGIIDSVIKTGRLSRAYIGVQYLEITPAIASQLDLPVSQGAYIEDESGAVIVNGPADKAGVRPGDIITKINGQVLNKTTTLTSLISRFRVGEKIELTILRNNQDKTVFVTLEDAVNR